MSGAQSDPVSGRSSAAGTPSRGQAEIGPGRLADRMVFLVGARRSGTNWLHRILGAHPHIAIVPSETHLFSHGLAPLVDRFHHGPSESPRTASMHMEHDVLYAACRDFCDRAFLPYLERAPEATLLVERTPWHVFHLDLIGSVYPDARVLHIMRDGRDVARSLVAQDWGPRSSGSLADAAEEWRSAIISARRSAESLHTYREVRYERLLEQPRERIAELYEWLGLSAEPQIMESAVAEASARFNVDTTAPSVTAAKWQLAMSSADIETVESVAGETLVELGYLQPGGSRRLEPAAVTPDGTGGADRPVPRTRPVRRAIGRAVRRIGVRIRAGDDDAGSGQMEKGAQVVDEFLDAIHTGRVDEVEALTTGDVRVRVVDRGVDWTGHGATAVRRLAATSQRHGLVGSRQRRGDVHPSPSCFTVVLSYADGPDGPLDALFVLHLKRQLVSHLTYYRLPLHPGGSDGRTGA